MTAELWFICAALTMPVVMHELFNLNVKREFRNGKYRLTPDGTDWALGLILASIIACIMWPLVYPVAVVRRITTREERRERKRQLAVRRNEEAFKTMRKAQKCLMDQKRQAYQAHVTEWNAEFEAADTYKIAAMQRSRELHEQRLAEREAERRIERERTYSDHQEYFGRYCRHGNSLDFPCSLCF